VIELALVVDNADALATLLREHVLRRRAFVHGAFDVDPSTRCRVSVPLPSGALSLDGEVVFVQRAPPTPGVGIQLDPLPKDALASIESFLLSVELPLPPPPEPTARELSTEPSTEITPSSAEDEADRTPPETLHVRMRSLTSVEQRRYALHGNLAERVLLERMYGPLVWETLLANGRLTPPEVATIARKGTLPRPLIEAIAANAGWLASGEVQRALLSNPRSSPLVVSKVLRMLPKHELARVPTQTAYPMAVRAAAKEMIKGDKR
jgi:hypothetical protein